MAKNIWISKVDTHSHLASNEMTLCNESITDGSFTNNNRNIKKVTCPKCIRAIRISMIYALEQIKPKKITIMDNNTIVEGNTEMKLIKVCKKNCDDKPFKATVKRKEYSFCCEKGFNKSIEDFAKEVNKKYKIPLL